jgi:hypothetical protein
MPPKTLAAASACALASCHYVPGTEAALFHEAEGAIKEILIDADSAEFRKLEAKNTELEGFATVCGEVNSRNRMGGYTGFKRFIAMPGKGHVVIDPEIDPDALGQPQDIRETQILFQGMWDETCEGLDGALNSAVKNLP